MKHIIQKIKKRILPQDEDSIRTRNARKKGFFLRFQKHPYVYSVEGLHAKFYLPFYRTDYIQQRILTENNYYEAGDLNYICKEWNHGVVAQELKHGIVLDIGTNIGNHTLYFCQECGAAFVHCFEPILSTIKILEKNIEINNLSSRVEIHPVAVGLKVGKAKIASYDVKNIGSTSLVSECSGEIPVICIDDLKLDKKVQLIKIDVEGYELQVIKGCIKTITRNHPYIMIEIRDEYIADIQKLLSPLGYKLERLSGINYWLYT